jgi:hypothetical protein
LFQTRRGGTIKPYGKKTILTILCTALLLALAHSAGGFWSRTIEIKNELPAEDTNEYYITAHPWNNLRNQGDSSVVIKEIQKVFGSSSKKAIQIATCESGLNPFVLNDNPRTGDYSVGVFQINLYGNLAKNRPSEEWLKDYRNNISYAHEMYISQGWVPWSCK